MAPSNVGGDSDRIDDLAGREQFYKDQLDMILEAVDKSVVNTLTEFHGESSDKFKENYEQFDDRKRKVEAAFDQVILETRNAADNWRMTSAALSTKFSV
ncbi:WXG100 family type VII secretion target [Nocardiopsis nanhaiensis]